MLNLVKRQKHKSKIDKQTSYEMHCAIQRVPPRVEYLELEPQPAAKRAYTDRDIQIKTLSRVKDQSQTGDEVTIKIQRRQGIINIRKQARFIKKGLPDAGIMKGFDSNFRASANGTSQPKRAGLLGPRRSMMYPKTLRSSKVKKATDTRSSRRETKETTK